MLFLLGIFISVFLELLLLVKKNKSRADKILVIWLFLIVIHQLLNYFLYTGESYNHPHWLGIQFSMPVLQGVLLFFGDPKSTFTRLIFYGLILFK